MSIKDELAWRKFPVLDRGEVCLVDVMGDDHAIAEAARVSFGKGTRSVSDDRTLIRYLMSGAYQLKAPHSSPFEMAEVKLRVVVPMDCWRQWIRHRTANVNEYSTRYSEAIDHAQRTPEDGWRAQATTNKQGSSGSVESWPDGAASPDDATPGVYLSRRESDIHDFSRQVYEERLRFGVAREQARKDLPLSTYTMAYWKCDLHNLMHFLKLRMDPHAQQEIRQYANVIAREIVAPLFPICWEAFNDYVLGAVTLSRLEVDVLGRILEVMERGAVPDGDRILKETFTNARERDACVNKLRSICPRAI